MRRGWRAMSSPYKTLFNFGYWNFWITATSSKLWLENQKLATWLIWLSCIHFWSQKNGICYLRDFVVPWRHTINWLKMMGINCYHNRGLLSVASCQQTPSCLTRLESHYLQEYGRVFNSFNRKRLKCILLVHFNHINPNRFRLKRCFPIE